MEIELRAALIDWLHADPLLLEWLNAIVEEAPSRVAPPWLAIAASASADWSTKDRRGREVRIALELHCRGDDPDTAFDAMLAIEERIETLPSAQAGFAIASCVYLRGRIEQRPANRRAVLLEYRFRLLAH
jgi:hypothetical protein